MSKYTLRLRRKTKDSPQVEGVKPPSEGCGVNERTPNNKISCGKKPQEQLLLAAVPQDQRLLTVEDILQRCCKSNYSPPGGRRKDVFGRLGEKIVAGDRENGRLVVFSKQTDKSNKTVWKQSDVLEVPGFKFNQIFAGRLGGDDNDVILVIGDSSFAVVRLQGERWRLEEVATWKSDEPRRKFG